jgi:hypothetical protein
MRHPLTRAAASCGLLLIVTSGFFTFGQRRQSPLACNSPVLAALKPRPELSYPCDPEANDSDEKILKLPARVAAIKTLMSELSSFTDAAWWAGDTIELGVCDFTREPAVLTRDKRHAFTDGEYLYWLFGNDHIRLALIPDPCFQTQYGGANAFLLFRDGRRVFVTQVLDGYFSRADNSVSIAFAKLKAKEIVEISTGSGGLNPTLTNYYFAVDPATRQAVPRKIFKGDRGLTNEISSAMLLSANGSTPLKIVRGNLLAPSFFIYIDDPSGKIDDNGRTLSRKTLRWNGSMYR